MMGDLFDFDFDFSDDVNVKDHSPPMSVEDIERLLFKDDDNDQIGGFLDDILLDSPVELEEEEVVNDLSDSAEDQQRKKKNVEEKDNNDHDPDPLSKKRKSRQLRNRDAAIRSRERKKMHIKDLEMKSRYYEAECRRLGSLLQWYMAENQALRFSLHTSTSGNASMTKQESAVLLLESLLLGSLLCLMVVLPTNLLVLLLLPLRPPHHPSPIQMVTAVVEEKHLPLPRLAPSRTQFKCLVGKRFKASRTRMRQVVSGFLVYFPFPIPIPIPIPMWC